jgi:hypothetical protein
VRSGREKLFESDALEAAGKLDRYICVDPEGPWGFVDAIQELFRRSGKSADDIECAGGRPEWFDRVRLQQMNPLRVSRSQSHLNHFCKAELRYAMLSAQQPTLTSRTAWHKMAVGDAQDRVKRIYDESKRANREVARICLDEMLMLFVNGGRGARFGDGVDAPTNPASQSFPYMREPNNRTDLPLSSFLER